MVRVAQFVFIASILGLPAVASAGPAEDSNAALLIIPTIQKPSATSIGPMQFFSELSVPYFRGD
jgi:hypothetical protein